MKKLGTILFLVILFSCNLETQRFNVIVDENFFKSPTNVEEALWSAYTALIYWEHEKSEIFFGDLRTNDFYKGGGSFDDNPRARDICTFTLNSQNLEVQYYWEDYYQAIRRANEVLRNIFRVDYSGLEELRNQHIGEAKFIRAFAYFHLSRAFGRVPIIPIELDFENLPGRSSLTEISFLVYSDLEQAIDNLPYRSDPNYEFGRANKGWARGLIGRVALFYGGCIENNLPAYQEFNGEFENHYNIGLTHLQNMVNEEGLGNYGLYPEYSWNFSKEGDFGEERVIEFLHDNIPGSFPNASAGSVLPTYFRERPTGWGFGAITKEFANAFDPADPRKLYTISKHGDSLFRADPNNPRSLDRMVNLVSQPHYNPDSMILYKYFMLLPDYVAPGSGDFNRGRHNIYIRYADVLLMLAELKLRVNGNTALSEAEFLVNRVRNRASGSSKTDINRLYHVIEIEEGGLLPHSFSSVEQAINLIAEERRFELAGEGLRYWDIIRWGDGGSLLSGFVETPTGFSPGVGFIEGVHELLPIPIGEISISNLEQNNGY